MFTFLLKLAGRNLWYRKGHSVAALLAFAGVLFVFSVLQAFSHGLAALWQTQGQPQAIVYKEGSQSEMLSQLSGDDVRKISTFLQNQWQISQVSAEMLVNVNLEQGEQTLSLPQRGLEPEKVQLRGASLEAGRWFRSGTDEIVVGRQLAATIPALQPGQRIQWGRQSWLVVGIFRHEQPMFDGEVWTDLSSLQSAFNRGNQVQSLYFRWDGQADLATLSQQLAGQLSVTVQAESTTAYFARQMADFKGFVDTLATGLAAVMLAGLVFGGASVLESAISSRRGQLLTMHAIGYSRRQLALALMVEAAVLGLFSAGVGLLLAVVLSGGQQISTMNQQSQLVVTLQMGAEVASLTVLAGVITAVLSALLSFGRLSRLQHL